jgi:hypothetical protein
MTTMTQTAGRRPSAARPAPTGGPRLRRPWRRALLTLHVITSVGWLGLDLGLLTLGITGLVTEDQETRRAAYLVMGVIGDVPLVPVSLGALLSGLALSLGTHWGLARHWWVLVKLVLTVAAFTATILALRGTIGEAVALVAGVPTDAMAAVDLGEVGVALVIAPSVALTIYTTATVLSVFKPWGRTPYGRRRAGGRAGT